MWNSCSPWPWQPPPTPYSFWNYPFHPLYSPPAPNCPQQSPLPKIQSEQAPFQKLCRDPTAPNDLPSPIQTKLRSHTKPPKSAKKTLEESEDRESKNQRHKYRNVPSNVAKMFVVMLAHHPAPEEMLPPSSDPQRRKQVLRCVRELRKHFRPGTVYIRPQRMVELCTKGVLSQESTLMLRVLFSRFIRLELRMLVASRVYLQRKEKVAYYRAGNLYLKSIRGSK